MQTEKDELAKRDAEWLKCFEHIDSIVEFDGDPEAYVGAVVGKISQRLREESELCVKLRNLCEELRPGSSSSL